MADKFRMYYECVGPVQGIAHGYKGWTDTGDDERDVSLCPMCGTAHSPFKYDMIEPAPPVSTAIKDLAAEHDPLDRAMPEEPHFLLLARDFRSPAMTRIYAATREGKWNQAHAVLHALEALAKQQTPAPHKDFEHATSAKAIANNMELWRMEHMQGENTGNRVNTTLDEVVPAPRISYDNLAADDAGALGEALRHDHIRHAKPPRDPGEAM